MILQPHPTLPPPVLHGEGMPLMELLYMPGRKEGRPELPSHTMRFLSAGLRGKSLPAGHRPEQWQRQVSLSQCSLGDPSPVRPRFWPLLFPLTAPCESQIT